MFTKLFRCPAVAAAIMISAADAEISQRDMITETNIEQASADGVGNVDEKDMVAFSIVSDRPVFVPGETTLLGLRFVIEPKWHVYWVGRNDTGFPITPEWTLPDGWTAGEIVWPAPHRHISPGDILDYVYENEVTLVLPIQVPDHAVVGKDAEISIDVDWLVCREACIPESASSSIRLPVIPSARAPSPIVTPRAIATTLARAPKRVSSSNGNVAQAPAMAWRNGELIVTPRNTFAWMAFYPAESSMNMVDPIRTGKVKNGSLRLKPDESMPSETTRLTGIIEINAGEIAGPTVFWIDEPVPPKNE